MKIIEVLILKHWKLLAKLTVAVLLLFLIIRGGREQIRNIDFYELSVAIRSLTLFQIILLIFLGLTASASMTLYDYAIIKYFEHRIKPRMFFNIAFAANSLNNLLGMGGLAGATVRTILLRKNDLGLNVSIYYNVLLAPAMPTGLSIMGVWFLFFSGDAGHIVEKYPWLYIGIAGVILILPAFFFLDRILDRFPQKDISLTLHRSVKLKLKLVGISFFEWMAAFFVFYYIVSMFYQDIGIGAVLGVYSIAAIAGIMSFMPGGLGSFDLIALIGLQRYGMETSNALAVLVLFRVFFFLTPAFVGMAFMILNLMMDGREKLFSYSYITNFGFFNSAMKYYKTYNDFINVLLSIMVFAGGIVLLISAVKPGIAERMALIAGYIPVSLLNFSQMISIVIGFLLCVLSVEILYKVKRAYSMAVRFLAAGIIFTFLKGLDFEEGLFLLTVLILLRFSKPNFYRFSIPVRFSKVIMVSALGLVAILLYYVMSERIFIEFLSHDFSYVQDSGFYGDILFHSMITFMIFSGFLFFLYFKKPRLENDPLFEDPDLEKLTLFLKDHTGDALSHLLFLGDKKFFWAAGNRVVIPYAKFRDLIVVLGDPIGRREDLPAAIHEFQDFLDKYGYEAVFYEVSDRFLSIYHESGYYFFKLGEEAIIDLDAFSLAGASRSNLRHTFNSFCKKGYTFEILDPPFGVSFLAECREISEEWLAGRKEMGFSMGWHNETYLNRSKIAALRDPEGKLLAFVSLMPSYDGNQSMSTDLMRIRSEVPHGTMDFIFLSLINYLKENHFRYFNLGMAPLSNVGMTPYSHFRERMARFAFQYGKFFYSFEGLRKYKEKYDPVWKPRYLAYPQLISLPATILEISMLVSSKKEVK